MSAIRVASAGHVVFAATIIALGMLGLIKGDFAVIWQPVPKALPTPEVLIGLCSAISLACGAGLLLKRAAAPAARVLLALLLFWLLLVRLPGFLRGFTVDVYWSACKTAVMMAGAWVLYVWFATEWDKQHLGFVTGGKGLHFARMLYGLSVIPFGLAHFTYLKPTAVLVPGWLPYHVAWAYFTGGAFMVAGAAILIGVFPRLAAAFSAVQMGLFLLLVWIPRVAAGSMTAFQWNETIVSLALAVAGWVMTDSYHGVPWLAVNGRWRHGESRALPMNRPSQAGWP